MKLKICILLSVLLSACRCPYHVPVTETVERVVETVRDSIVSVPADSSYIQAWLECDSLGKAHLKAFETYKAGLRMPLPEIRIIDNLLRVDCKVDSFGIYLKVKDRFTTRNEVKTVYVYENRLKAWQKGLMFSGIVFLLIIVVVIISKLKKII